MVVLLTKKARASQWVNQEIGYGAALNKVIVPVVQVDGVRRRRIPYFGFTELSDPVSLSMIAPEGGISDLLRTLTARALDDRSWTGQVKIKCACGYNGAYRARRLTVWRWDCRRCGQKVSVSPVTYEPLP